MAKPTGNEMNVPTPQHRGYVYEIDQLFFCIKTEYSSHNCGCGKAPANVVGAFYTLYLNRWTTPFRKVMAVIRPSVASTSCTMFKTKSLIAVGSSVRTSFS